MARRNGSRSASRIVALQYALERLQEGQERHALKLAALERRLTEFERQIGRHSLNGAADGTALSPAALDEVRELSRELALYRRLVR